MIKILDKSSFLVVKDHRVIRECSTLEQAKLVIEDLRQTEKISFLLKNKLFKKLIKKGIFHIRLSDYYVTKVIYDYDESHFLLEEDDDDDF